MPFTVDGDSSFVTLHRAIVPPRFPIPEPKFALWVSTAQKLAIWWKFKATSISGGIMSWERLFAIRSELAILAVIYLDFIVHGLAYKMLLVWVHSGCWHRMHVRFWYVFDRNGNSELPNIHFLVFRSRNKISAIFDESQGVYRTQMLLICLHNWLFSIQVILSNLFVRRAS